MKIKTMIISALAALCLTGAFASVASAEGGVFVTLLNGKKLPAHVVQTPTGPMTVPDSLVETNADGSGVIDDPCNYLPLQRREMYTFAEWASNLRGYCFEAPGTVPIDQAKVTEMREAYQRSLQQKRQHTAHKHGRH